MTGEPARSWAQKDRRRGPVRLMLARSGEFHRRPSSRLCRPRWQGVPTRARRGVHFRQITPQQSRNGHRIETRQEDDRKRRLLLHCRCCFCGRKASFGILDVFRNISGWHLRHRIFRPSEVPVPPRGSHRPPSSKRDCDPQFWLRRFAVWRRGYARNQDCSSCRFCRCSAAIQYPRHRHSARRTYRHKPARLGKEADQAPFWNMKGALLVMFRTI